jgi:hypothetical protein
MEFGVFSAATDPSHEDYLDDQKVIRLRALAPFYSQEVLRDLLVPFLDTNADLSLRHLDHLVTHMSRCEALSYEHGGTIVRLFDVYRRWLRVWKVRSFRREAPSVCHTPPT